VTWEERFLVARSMVALPCLALALRRWGLGPVRAALARRMPSGEQESSVDERTASGRLAWCVHAAAAYGPWRANCLQRSVLLWWYLGRRGMDGDLRIGVRRLAEGEGLAFHAWVELDGTVLNDHADVRQRYATFEGSIAPRGAAFR
jgi:hypothetical protein